jgi:hypothetical protein
MIFFLKINNIIIILIDNYFVYIMLIISNLFVLSNIFLNKNVRYSYNK